MASISVRTSALRAVAGVAVATGLLTGCYTYGPMEMSALTPDLEVRTRVTGAEADRLAEFLGSDSRIIDGTVQEIDDDNLLLLVPVLSSIERGRGGDLNQRIEILRDGLVEIEVKQLDRARTGVMFAAATVALGVVVIGQLNQDQGGGEPPVITPPPEDRVFRFPFSFRWGGN